MLSLDRYLTELKTEADALYEDTEVYGIAGWDKESVANSRLLKFCMALPKGAELRSREPLLRLQQIPSLFGRRNGLQHREGWHRNPEPTAMDYQQTLYAVCCPAFLWL